MDKQYKYDAFISYRHTKLDKAVAVKLQKKLEGYKLPKSVSKDFKKWKVFRDETELNSTNDLSAGIKEALEKSRFLIVVCSETTKDSRWCMEEISYFKKLHNGSNSNIITVVADGNPDEVFPEELCKEIVEVTDENGNVTYEERKIEPLAANLTGKSRKKATKNLNGEFLRIAAPIAGCDYDNLYNRNQKRFIKRLTIVGVFVLLFLLIFALYTSAMLYEINTQKTALQEANISLQNKTKELNESNEILKETNENLAKKTQEAEDNLDEANRQKTVAENNLAEANRQKKLAEDNLKEANRQKKFAEDNLAEANRQKAIAIENKDEANRQKTVAEENMLLAQKNEETANKLNDDLIIKNSEILTNQAKLYSENGDTGLAVAALIEALPEQGAASEHINYDAISTLTELTRAYSSNKFPVSSNLKLDAVVEDVEFTENGERIIASDKNGNIVLIDYSNAKIINTLSVKGEQLEDYCFDNEAVYAVYDNTLIKINAATGAVEKQIELSVNNEYITTNINSDYIVVYGFGKYELLNKNLEKISYGEIDHVYSLRKNCYMDDEGNTYIYDDSGMFYHISDSGCEGCSVGTDDSNFLGITATRDLVFLNLCIPDNNFSYVYGKMICFNKQDMSVKWETDYKTDQALEFCANMFEFTHNIQEENKDNYVNKQCILASSGKNVLCFDKETGENYFKATSDESIIYCAPNENEYSLRMSTGNMFVNRCFLYNNITEGAGFTEVGNQLVSVEWRDMEYKCDNVAYSHPSKYALVRENSKNIEIYRDITPQNYTPFDTRVNNYISNAVGNSNGLVATAFSDNNKLIINVFNSDSNKNIARYEIEKGSYADRIIFTDEDILFIYQGDRLDIIDLKNEKVTAVDFVYEYKKAFGLKEEDFVPTIFDFYSYKNSILQCGNKGIVIWKFNEDGYSVLPVITVPHPDLFTISENLLTWVNKSYTKGTEVIEYFKPGDEEISFVLTKGTPAGFKLSEIKSTKCSPKGEYLAFITEDFNLGIYKCGEDDYKTASLGNSIPEDYIFTDDGKYIILAYSNGVIKKCSVTEGKIVAECDLDMELSVKKIVTAGDDIILECYSEAILFNVEAMKKTGVIYDYKCYMPEKGKFVYSACKEENNEIYYEIGTYNYLTIDKLIELGNNINFKINGM